MNNKYDFVILKFCNDFYLFLLDIIFYWYFTGYAEDCLGCYMLSSDHLPAFYVAYKVADEDDKV